MCKNMYFKVFVLYVLAAMNFCETHKILLVFPFPFKSHGFLGEALANLLIKAGHDVSYITANPVAYSHPNLSQIRIKPYKYMGFHLNREGRVITFQDIFNRMFNVSYLALMDANVQRIMEDNGQTFDLVIAEWMNNDLYSGLSVVFNCPFIWFFTFHIDHEIMRLIHESPNPLITTNMITNNVPPLNFLQRVQELAFVVTSKVSKYFHYDPIELRAYEEIFGSVLARKGRILPPYDTVRYNASFVLSNSHSTIRDSPVMPQNYKAIGGFHISDTPKPLSQELSNILESIENDVVLFSFGSFLKAEEMSKSMKEDLLLMFSKLNYTIFWKIDEQFENIPSNVRTFPWIPLQSVLAHSKCVLFVTHGGILSLTESVHYAVPVIGIPVFGDQKVNIMTIVKKGAARIVQMGATLAEELKEAIEDVLSDPRYKENMMKLSALYHDRPMSPGSELVHWVEHVVTTRGAPHLRSPALSMPWYQKNYLDLATLLLVLIIGLRFVINKLFKCLDKVKSAFVMNNRSVKNKLL